MINGSKQSFVQNSLWSVEYNLNRALEILVDFLIQVKYS